MIQRIQSLYLVASLILLSFVFMLPYGLIIDANGTVFNMMHYGMVKMNAVAWTTVQPQMLVTATLYVAMTLVMVSIFLYRNLKVQILICHIAIAMHLLLLAIMLIRVYTCPIENIVSTKISWAIIMPLLSSITTYLAVNAIKKDDDTIKSIDRIR